MEDDLGYNEENIVIQLILENSAIAVYYAAVDNNVMARYWKVSNKHNDVFIEDYIRINQ